MNDKDDPIVKDLIKQFGIELSLAINIMYQIRGNTKKYFEITNKQ